MARTVIIVAIVVLILLIFLCECIKEPFTFAVDICSAIDKDGSIYTDGSPQLKELCSSPENINPEQTCTVGCDMRTLCRNPGVRFCAEVLHYHPFTCDVSKVHYGGQHAQVDLPPIYRIRKGTCLVADAQGRVANDAGLRACLFRFPSEISVVAKTLATSQLSDSWTLTIENNNPAKISLPLKNPEYANACADFVPSVPTIFKFESGRTPAGQDTSISKDRPSLLERVTRARTHKNQPGRLHVTFRFTLPATSRAKFGDKYEYVATVPEERAQSSPFCKKPMSSRTDVWLCLSLRPRDGKVDEVREIVSGSDGKIHVYRSNEVIDFDMSQILTVNGTEPEIWLGLRDGAVDHGLA
jgi:hypothetical protein